MKRKSIIAGTVLGLLYSQVNFAETGLFFNVSTIASILNITTTIPSHTYPHAGIKIDTPGYSVNGCKPNEYGYCLFSVSDTKQASLAINGPRGSINVTLCLQGQQPLSCQHYSGIPMTTGSAQFAYLTQFAVPTISKCNIDAASGQITTCSDFAGPSLLPNTDIAFNSAGTFAYVGTFNTGVFVCNVNPTTGVFSNCVSTGSGFGNNLAGIELNQTNTFAYISDQSNNNIAKCDINSATGALSNCVVAVPGVAPTDFAFSPTGNFIYYGFGSTVTKCSVDLATGNLSSCGSASPSVFSNAGALAINPLGTTAYVLDFMNNGSVQMCNINSGTGDLTSCALTGDISFQFPSSIKINSTGTRVYIAEIVAGVDLCFVNPTTGALELCSPTGPNTSAPTVTLL